MNAVAIDVYKELLGLLNRMDAVKMPYSLKHTRPDAITVVVSVPGEYWEIEFVDYGDEVQLEVEVFRGGGVTGDEKSVEELFAKWAA